MTQLFTRETPDRTTHILAVLLGAPAIVAALTISALETWRWISPNSALFGPPAAASFAEAIARDDARGAYEFIRAGQDPNGAIAVRDDVLTGGRRVETLPLVWAVATQSDRSVAMLLGFGARQDATTKHQAVCLATRLGRDDILQLLLLSGPDTSAEPCPALPAGTEDAPLLPSS